MTVPRFSRFLSVVVLLFLLASCRLAHESASCSELRAFGDSTGEALERQRNEVLWAQVKGRLDSLLATRSGAAAWDRAPRSQEEDAKRYADSLEAKDGAVRFRSGCVNWNRSWAEGGFDRMALATAMVRALLSDTVVSAMGVEPDSAAIPAFLDVDVLHADQSQKTMRLVLDSAAARVAP